MDANFEKAVFERIVEWSSKSDTSQCFLITPKIQVSIIFVRCAFLGIQLLVLCVLCCILGFALSGALMLARSFGMFIYIRTHTHTLSLVIYYAHPYTHTHICNVWQGGMLDNVGKNICVLNIFKGRDMCTSSSSASGPRGHF